MRHLLLLLLSGITLVATAQTGTEFWMAPPDVTLRHNNPGDEPIFLNVTTAGPAATVTVEQPANGGFNGGTPIVLNVPANSSVRYNLSSLKAQLETRPTNSVRNTGLRISSTENITCYYELSNTNNPDIMALKGANGLGLEFYVPLHKHAPFHNHDYSGHPNDLAFASFDIVATENNTSVMIYSPVDVDGHQALAPFTITLNRGQTYSCANTDLATHTDPSTHPSGAVILADKPVAVSVKDDSNHNPSGGCYDLMLDQIVPINILGTEYVAVKGQLNNTGDESLFIMAVENNTEVFVDGGATPVATLFAGQLYRRDMDYLASSANNSTLVTTTKPVYAIHVTGFGCEQGMAILPPLNCAGSSQLSFTRSTAEGFFLNILVRDGSQDDFTITGPGTAAINPASFVTVPGTGNEWVSAQLPFNTTEVPVNQAFIISNSTDVFSLAIINGGATSGCRYGFFSEFAGEIIIDAGVQQDLCVGENAVLSGSVSGGSTTGIWTSSGGGSFTPSATALNATYVPSAGDQALGSVTLTLTSTGNCTPVSDDVLITFQALPIADAGTDQDICVNNPVVALNGSVVNAVSGVWSGGAGTFNPSNGDLNASYTPTAAEIAAGSLTLTLTTAGNGECSAQTDDMVITFTPSPTVSAGPDQTLCSNAPIVSLSGSFTVASGAVWSGGGGSFNPSNTNVSATYTPSNAEVAAGSVTLTLTSTGNGNCNAVSDQVLINFTAAPTANAGSDVTVCENNASVSLNGSVTVATGGSWTGGTGTFTPNNNSLNASYQPSLSEIAAGSVQLMLTTTGNGNCAAVRDSMIIHFTTAPQVNAGTDGTICATGGPISLNGTVTIASGGVWSSPGTGTFTPNNTSLSTSYQPSAAEISSGSVTLTLSSAGNGNCNAETDDVTFTITPGATVNAGADQTLCANNADATLNAVVTVATGVQWSGGNGSYSPGNNAQNVTYSPSAVEISNGSVTLTATTTGHGSCAAETDDITLTFTDAPTANAGPDATVCANNATVALNGFVTIASGGTWSGGTGTYNPNSATPGASYTPSAAEIATGTVTLTLTTTGNSTCNAVSDDKIISITPAPVVDPGTNATVCATGGPIQLNGSVTVATGGAWSGGTGTFSPNNNALNATYQPSAAEIASGGLTLYLTSTGNGNCASNTEDVTFGITPGATVNAGADQTLCGNNADAILNATFTVASGVQWSGGSGSFTPANNAQNVTYSPSAAEITAGSVTLTATTTGNGNCAAESDDVVLNFTPSPTANAGADVSVCENNAQVSLNGAVTVATAGTWTGGSGTFTPNNNTLAATYLPSAAEIAAGSVTLTLTTTGNASCNAVSDDMTITITTGPTVDAGADVTVCATGGAIALGGSVTVASGGTWSGGNGTFSPNANTLNASYLPSAAEAAAGTVTLTLTTIGNANCNAVSDDMTITITPGVTINAGADQTLCGNNADAILNATFTVASGVQWSGGSGSFTPASNAQNVTYSPSAAEITSGSVTITATSTGNGSCAVESDDVVLNFTPSPTANAGADVSVCENNAEVSLSAAVTVATGGTWTGGSGTFSPNNNTLAATYLPSAAEIAAGSVTLTLTTTGNASCNAVSDDMTITITTGPTVDAGADVTVCATGGAIALGGSVTVASGGTWSGGNGTFSPNANTLNASYLPSAAEAAAGTVTLTLTTIGNANCNAVSDDMTITITPGVTINAGADQTLCGNNAEAVLNATVNVATGVQWSGGSGSYTPANNAQNITYSPSIGEVNAGSVTLTVTSTGNGNCAAESDQVTLNFSATPTANAGADVSVSSNNADVTLNGSQTVASGGQWTGGLGVYNPNNLTSNAVYTPSAGEIAAGSVTLTYTTTGNGTCSAVSDQMTITFSAAPTADAGADQTLCGNNADVSLSGSVTIATGGIWSGGNGTFSPSASDLTTTYTPTAAEIASGSVTLTLTTVGNGNSNPESDDMTVSFTPAPTVSAGSDQNSCANNAAVSLTGAINNATGGIWSGGLGSFNPSNTNSSPIYTPTAAEIAAGTVTLTLTSTGNGNCNAVSDQMTINISQAPIISAGADILSCSNNPTSTLNASISHASGVIWSGGTGAFSPNVTALSPQYTPSTTELQNGSVTLTVTSTGNGTCLAESDDVLLVFSQSPTVNAGSDVTVCVNDPQVNLSGAVTIASGGIWTGGGSFSPSNTALNATYMPSPAELALGQAVLTLTSTGNGDCTPVSDQMVIAIIASPVADAGADLFVCSNNPDVQLGASVSGAGGGQWSGGAGVYTPAITALNAVYSPTPAEILSGSVTLTLTTIGNGSCTPVTDELLITFTNPPIADAGLPASFCANNAEIQLNGSVAVATGGAWSGAQGTFTPNSNTLNAIYQPSLGEVTAGSVSLILTTTANQGCAAVSDTVTYTFTPAPTANAGIDTTICASTGQLQLDGAVTLAAGGLWSNGTGTFTPSTGNLNAVYTPSAQELSDGQLTLLLTTVGNGTCNEVVDSVNITIDADPIVNAGPDQDICENAPITDLAGFVGNAPGGVWSGFAGTFNPGATNLVTQYTPTPAEIQAGSLTLTLSSTGTTICPAVSDAMTINFTDAPIVLAGQDMSICSNNPDAQLNGFVSNASGGSWSGGSGTFTPSPNVLSPVYTPTPAELVAGSVQLILTSTGNGNCVQVNDTLVINFTPAPTVDAGLDADVCANNATVQLNGAVTVAPGAEWSGFLGTFGTSSTDLSSTYTLAPFEIQNGSVTLTLTTTGNGNCNAVSDEVTINVTPAPVVDAGLDQTICANDLDVMLNGSVSGGTTTGDWSTGGTGTFLPSPNVLNATYRASALDSLAGSVVLTLTSTNNGLCSVETDQVTINILPNAIADAGVDQSICASDSVVTLDGTITGNATQGYWTTTGSGSFSPDSSYANATYTSSASDEALGTLTFTWAINSCDDASDDMELTIVPVSAVDAGADQVTCASDLDVVLNATVSGASASGTWSTLGSGTFLSGNNALSNVYSASVADSTAQGVDLILTASNTSVCQAASDTLHIDIFSFATVDVGSDETFCANNVNLQLNGQLGGNADVILWTTSGNGTFLPNATILNPFYIPSPSDTAIGNVTLTMSVVNSCNNANDDMEVSLTPAPYVSAGADQVYCNLVTQFNLNGIVSGITTIGEWATTGTGVIADPTSLATTYTASQADIDAGRIDLTLTSVGNANCTPVVDEMSIYITNGLTISAGPDQQVCISSDHAQLQGTIQDGPPSGQWSTSGTGTFSPSPDVLNAQYLFSANDVANGSVVLTLLSTENGNCVAVQDQMLLTFGNASYVYAGEDQMVCENDPIARLAGNFSGGASSINWSSDGSGSFSNTTDPNATYTLSAADISAGSVTLSLSTITDGTCAPSVDEMTVFVDNIPIVNAGSDLIVCTSDPVQLNANVSNASGVEWTTSGTGTFFDANAVLTLYYPSASDSIAGVVTLTATSTGNGECAAVSDQMELNFGSLLVSNAGSDIVACSTSPDVALNGLVSGTSTGVWSTSGTGSFFPNASDLNATYQPGAADFVIGDISLTLSTTNNLGCPAGTDTMVVSYHVPPTADAGSDVILCDGIEAVNLNAFVQNHGSLNWLTTGSGSFAPNDTAATTSYMPSVNDSIAGGVHLVLTAVATGNCNSTSDSIFIDIGPRRVAQAGSDVLVCADGSDLQMSGTIEGVTQGVWTTNGTGSFSPDATDLNAVYAPSSTDLVFNELNFILTTTDNQGCPAHADTLVVSLEAVPVIDAGLDISTCDPSLPITLNGYYSNALGIEWVSSGTGSFIPDAFTANAVYQPSSTDTLLQELTMVMTSTGTTVCSAVTDTMIVSFVNPLSPDFSYGLPCAGSPLEFTDASTVTSGEIIAWNWTFGPDGTTANGPMVSHTFPTTGQYAVNLTLTSDNGCTSSSNHTLDVMPSPTAGFSFEGDYVVGHDIVFTDLSYDADAWMYDFGDGLGVTLDTAPVYQYPQAGQFMITQTVTNSIGCTDEATQLVIIEDDEILPPKLPNAFSPNGDGVNDIFYVRGGPFETLELSIFNGWGEMIFFTTDPTFGWDGTHNGKSASNGVYVYIVKATTVDGREHDRTSKVTLIR